MQQKDAYKTLQKAAEIIHHRLSYLDGDVIPNLFYHRECYQRFTLKRDLEKIVQKETEREEFEKSLLNKIQFETNEAGRLIRKTNENSSGIVLKKECIFCKRNIYKNKKLVKLTQYLELRAVQAIYNAAYYVNDFEILGLLNSNDIIAAEAHHTRIVTKRMLQEKLLVKLSKTLMHIKL